METRITTRSLRLTLPQTLPNAEITQYPVFSVFSVPLCFVFFLALSRNAFHHLGAPFARVSWRI